MTSTFYPPYHIGGDATHVKYLAEELIKIGHEVHVFYNRDAYAIKRRNPPQIVKANEVLIHEFKSFSNLSPYAVYFFGNFVPITKAYNALVKQIRPDIIHHHNISLLGYDILKSGGACAKIYTAHDFWLVCPQNNLLRNGAVECNTSSCSACSLNRKKPPQLWRHNHNFKKAINNIDEIISPSEYLQKKVTQKIDVKSVVIRNFAPDPPNNIMTCKHSDYFLFVGALEIHKGILNLLEVFRRAKDKIGSKLVIVGAGSLARKISQYIRDFSLEENVVFVGNVSVEELYSLYKNAHAIILPAIWPENSPLVLLESLSVGTPAIVTNKVDNRLIFNSLDELENILIGFKTNRYNKQKLSQIFVNNFSANAYIKKYLALIKNLK
jgi:glycosyltransferase involved in cell wall biosynthesis